MNTENNLVSEDSITYSCKLWHTKCYETREDDLKFINNILKDSRGDENDDLSENNADVGAVDECTVSILYPKFNLLAPFYTCFTSGKQTCTCELKFSHFPFYAHKRVTLHKLQGASNAYFILNGSHGLPHVVLSRKNQSKTK